MIHRLLRRLGTFLTSPFRGRAGAATMFREAGGVAAFWALQDERVCQELNLNIEQLAQVIRLTRQARLPRRPQFQALKNRKPRRAVALRDKLNRAIAVEVLAGLDKAAVLTPDQKVRLRQIAFQRQGVIAFGTPVVQQVLKLTPNQKEVLKRIIEVMRKRLRARRGHLDAGKETADSLRQNALEKALALLDPEQKRRWEKLKGKPFEFPNERNSADDDASVTDEIAP